MASVPNYESDEEIIDVNLKQPKVVVERKWCIEATLDDQRQVDEFLIKENTWGFGSSSNTAEGRKIYYRCNKVKARGTQCEAKIFILYDAFSTKITATNSHTHEQITTKAQSGIPENVKRRIEELWDLSSNQNIF